MIDHFKLKVGDFVMGQTKILIVDDEPSIRTLLEYNLKQAGYDTLLAVDGEEAIRFVEQENPNLILLDLMIPKVDGIEVCKTLRAHEINTPIIMLTAKSGEGDKILGLDIGADDYMTKPFSPKEVIARVKAVLRRTDNGLTKDEEHNQLTSGEITIYIDQYEAYLSKEKLEFTPKEFELLVYFIRNKNRVLSRDALLSAVWNYDFAGDTRIVDVHVSHLRDKIEEDKKRPKFIKTVRGIGYKFEEVR